MLILLKKLKKLNVSVEDPKIREKYGVLSGGVGIVLNLMLFAVKLFAALISGSVAIIADAFNSLSDAFSSIITLVGMKMSGLKPDVNHPFGHGRFEYITGFIISILIIIMGYDLAGESIKGVIHPEKIQINKWVIIILIISIITKLYMALYNKKYSEFFDSGAMKATASDSFWDAISGLAVLICVILSQFSCKPLDAYAGLAVSAFILISGINSAKETISPLLGTPPKQEVVDKIEEIVKNQRDIIGMHDLIVHDYGPGRVMISLHAEIPSSKGVFGSHEIVDKLEKELEKELHCEAVVHSDPVDTDDTELTRLRDTVNKCVMDVDRGLSMHDFRYIKGKWETTLMFDVVVPFSMEIDEDELRRQICRKVEEKLPNHWCEIKFDMFML